MEPKIERIMATVITRGTSKSGLAFVVLRPYRECTPDEIAVAGISCLICDEPLGHLTHIVPKARAHLNCVEQYLSEIGAIIRDVNR